MNAQEYIASGLLEAYVLGALPAAEATEVAGAMVRYPEVAAEVAAIEEAFLQLGQASAIEPPAHLQEQIWNTLSAGASRPAAVTNTISTDGAANRSSDGATPRTIAFEPQRKGVSLARAAVWAALVVSALLNLFLWNSGRVAEQDMLAMKQRLDTAAEGQRALAIALSKYEHEVSMMANPDMHPVVMKTTQKSQPMVAVIYYNSDGSDAYVSLQRMPDAPQGMQYQLWALADGKPIDLGVIRNDMVKTQGIEKVDKAVPSGQAFAISLEKEGGSPTPTMDKIFVMGKVAS